MWLVLFFVGWAAAAASSVPATGLLLLLGHHHKDAIGCRLRRSDTSLWQGIRFEDFHDLKGCAVAV